MNAMADAERSTSRGNFFPAWLMETATRPPGERACTSASQQWRLSERLRETRPMDSLGTVDIATGIQKCVVSMEGVRREKGEARSR